ncbi:hypothetical protein C9374_001388 [Naegleria lovaniensis]|uniref:Uncharacterized protein n=1 Tax=Naegleria lovaniensis TaxID=51637 RepID=A0AA88GXA1_NAELO|nr:uncharacterized protein C9374_001388 [Naegleria lovaniensis]KAG2387794.1 hypothetical protein C9374_001388 [Naegleria lovaniensis]
MGRWKKKYNYNISCGSTIFDSVLSKLLQTKEKITTHFNSELSRLRDQIKKVELDRDQEKELKTNALGTIQQQEEIISNLRKQLESMSQENRILKESNKTLKQKETTALLEIETLKEKNTNSTLTFKDMKEENEIMKNEIDMLKIEVEKLQTEKQVLSRELDIQLYRHNLNTGETFDKRVLNIDKGCGITTREKEMELDLLIYRKRLENLTPSLELVIQLAIEQFECFDEVMNVVESLMDKKDERMLLSMVARNKKFSLFQNFQKDMPESFQQFMSSLNKEHDRLAQYNSDDEEYEKVYSAKERMCNKLLRKKQKDNRIFKHKVECTPEEYSNATKYYEELKGAIPQYSVLMKDDTTVVESKNMLQYHEQKLLSYGEYLNNLQARLTHTKSPSSPPRSLAISHFQKDSGKKLLKQKSKE